MTLTYNGVALAELGELVIMPPAVRYEPADAPQRAVHTLTVRLHSWQQGSWEDNYETLRTIARAVATQHALLEWVDGNGVEQVSRPVRVVSHSFPEEGATVEHTSHQSIEIVFEWLDHLSATTANALTATYQRTGSAAALSLGQVERFGESYQASRVSGYRSHRWNATGTVNASGRLKTPTTASISDQRAALLSAHAQLLAEIENGKDGTLVYGAAFNRVIRVENFTPQIDQAAGEITWSLTGSFTRFPDESDYAITDYRLVTTEDNGAGVVRLRFSGTVNAPTAATARTALATLRASLVDASFALLNRDDDDRTAVTGDGTAFVELTFNEEYQKASADVLQHTLRRVDSDALATGLVDTSLGGTVRARGTTEALALAVALAQARALGQSKEAVLGGGAIALDEREVQVTAQHLTSGAHLVEVEFEYTYRRKGAKVYLEYTSELNTPVFEAWTESVSGLVVAADHATAAALYATHVKTAYNARALLDERTTRAYEQRVTATAGTLPTRFSFSFSVARTRTASGERAARYAVQTSLDYRAQRQHTTVQGVVVAETESAAIAYRDTLLGTLGALGELVRLDRSADFSKGRTVAGGAELTTFYKLDFTAAYEKKLTGDAGILQCELTVATQYAGTRWVVHAIPGGVSVLQSVGTETGQRTVSGSCVATNYADAEAWALLQREAHLARDYEQPPRLEAQYDFPMRIEGDVGVENFSAVRVTFHFTEWLPATILA